MSSEVQTGSDPVQESLHVESPEAARRTIVRLAGSALRVSAAVAVVLGAYRVSSHVDILPFTLVPIAVYILMPLKRRWKLAAGIIAFVMLFVFAPV